MDAFLAAVGWPVVDRIGVGPIQLSPHGLFIAIGFLVGTIPFGRLAERRGIPPVAITSVAFWSLIGAIVGARVGYVIAHPSDFASPLEWFYVWQGGISLLGGIAGATIANAVNIKRFHLRFFRVADTIVPALAFGIVVGRIGDLDHRRPPRQTVVVAPRVVLPRRHARAPLHVRRTICARRARGRIAHHRHAQRGRAARRPRRGRARVGWGSTRRRCTTCCSPRCCSACCGGSSGRTAARGWRRCCSGSGTAATGCSRTRCGSTSGSVRSPGRSGRRSPWWCWRA